MGPEASRQTTGQMGSCAAIRVSSARAAPPASARGHTAHSAKTRTHAPTRPRFLSSRCRSARPPLPANRRRRSTWPPSETWRWRRRPIPARSSTRPSATGWLADVTLGNLEGTLATGGSSKCGAGSENCFAFRAPPSYAPGAPQGRLHDRERREQPRARLRRDGAGGDARSGQGCRLAPHGQAGRDRLSREGRHADRADRRRALRLGAGSPRHRRRRAARAQGGPEGGCRDRDDARGRRRAGRAARPRGHGDVPRREPRATRRRSPTQ